MERRHGFIPSALDRLESRVVLSHAAANVSVVASGLAPHLQVLNRRQQPIIAEINQSFDLFASDYSQARATYFASIVNQSTPAQATTSAFTLYTTQRVSLLAEQLMSDILQSSLGKPQGHGNSTLPKLLIDQKVIGPQGQHPKGSLAQALLDSIPQPGTSAPTASLYSLSQDNAIETARVAVINGVNIIKSSDLSNKSH